MVFVKQAFWFDNWGALLLVLFFAGCCTSYPGASYIDADEETYNYAQPKLEEWAKMKAAEGDEDWEVIVNGKGISWKARIDRGKKLGQEETE